ncbi:MAG: hypothetical protein AAF663_02920, partial [Planctomycetota bacterium]
MRPSFGLTTAALALVATGLTTTANAAIIGVAGDTYVTRGDLINDSDATSLIRNTQNFVSTREETGTANNDRIGVLYFDLTGITTDSAGSSLSLTVSGLAGSTVATSDDPLVFSIFGANDNTPSDNFTDAGFVASLITGPTTSIDTGGNLVRETAVFGGAPGSPASPLATVSLTALPTVGDTLTFSSSLLDDFINSVTGSVIDDDLAFLITIDGAG